MKLLCICHANICRSFMAQEFFKHLLPGVEVFSRGFYADSSYRVPQKVMDALATHGIGLSEHTSTQLTPADLQAADLIFCMEQAHEDRLLDHYAQYTDKIWLLTDFAYDKREDIPDPISFDSKTFEKAAESLYQSCQAAAKRIAQDFPKNSSI